MHLLFIISLLSRVCEGWKENNIPCHHFYDFLCYISRVLGSEGFISLYIPICLFLSIHLFLTHSAQTGYPSALHSGQTISKSYIFLAPSAVCGCHGSARANTSPSPSTHTHRVYPATGSGEDEALMRANPGWTGVGSTARCGSTTGVEPSLSLILLLSSPPARSCSPFVG